MNQSNNCILRKWQLSDAKDLADALNNERILNNLRDRLPFPYTEQDACDYISAMLSSDENSTFAYAITIDGRASGQHRRFSAEQYPPSDSRAGVLSG